MNYENLAQSIAKKDSIDIVSTEQMMPPVGPGHLKPYPQLTPDPEELKESPMIAESKRKSAGRKHRYSYKYQKKILLDEFNEPYFAHESDDISISVGLSLPASLVDSLDKKIEKIRSHENINRRKEKLKRSRYIRQLIEKDLGLEYREEY